MKKRIKMLISIGIEASLIIILSQSKVHASTLIGTVQVKAHSLYLRAGNSFNAKVVRTLHKGKHYNVYAKKNGMYNLGQNRWVTASATYVSSNGSVSSHNTAPSPTSVKEPALSKNANGIISYAKCFLGMRYIWASANPLYMFRGNIVKFRSDGTFIFFVIN